MYLTEQNEGPRARSRGGQNLCAQRLSGEDPEGKQGRDFFSATQTTVFQAELYGPMGDFMEK